MVRRGVPVGLYPLLLVLAWCWAPLCAAAIITASVDRSTVSVDESFYLILEAEGEFSADPDLAPLTENFEILNQSRTQNVSIINGRAMRRDAWQIELMPTEAGSFTIPAIAFGTESSNPVSILVKPARPPGEGDDPGRFFLEVEVDEPRPYVQQQIIYTVRLFRGANATSPRLSEPAPEGVDTIVERVGKDNAYSAHRGGRRYRVTERRYAIFPQASGRLVLPPLRFQAKVLEAGRPRSSVFDAVRTRNIRVRSRPIELSVMEAPANAPEPWLPARSLALEESWSTTGPVTAGDALTRRITMQASGLTAAQLPELDLGLPDGIKHYPEQAELDNLAGEQGLTGKRMQTIALVATRPGSYVLPEVAITWWNVDTGQAERTLLPSRTVEVLAATQAGGVDAPLPSDRAAGDGAPPADKAGAAPGYWRWLSALLALAWLLTLWFWRQDRRLGRQPVPAAGTAAPPDLRQALAGLQRACADNDAQAARDALAVVAAAAWPEAPPRNLSQLAARCGDGLAAEIADLQRALYAPSSPGWEGARLWALAKTLASRPAPEGPPEAAVLAPLYQPAPDRPGAR